MEQGLNQHLQSTVNMFPLGIYRGNERNERDEESSRICGGGQRNHTQELLSSGHSNTGLFPGEGFIVSNGPVG